MNFNTLEVNRIIMHTISQKEMGQDSARAEISNSLIQVDNTVVEILKQRLINAAGKHSRAFELEISQTGNESFFSIASEMSNCDDDSFVDQSKELAELLASSQRLRVIPGGYLIVIDAKISSDASALIVIKAEPHEALRLETDSRITLLERVFLSPSQKLYKIGVLFEKDRTKTLANEKYGALLFDDQFRQDGQPAEYFYRDFLGLSTSKNAKIQTLQFYNKSVDFIVDKVSDSNQKSSLLYALKSFTRASVNATIRPLDFANTYLTGHFKDSYLSDVADSLPSAFVKDSILITSKLKTRKMFFSNKVNVIGSEDNFDENVKIISTIEDLESLDCTDPDYSILVVKGKPFTDEE